MKNKSEEQKKESFFPTAQENILRAGKEFVEKSRELVNPKRATFRNRLKLYNNQRKQRDKIGDTTLYNVLNTALAIYYSDELNIVFAPRDPGDNLLVENITNTAKFDYEEMDMDIIDYLVQWDKGFFGVGIRVMNDWDVDRKVPVPRSIDPMCWLPDPFGYLIPGSHRWHGFEIAYLETELTEERGFFNTGSLKARSSGGEQDAYIAALRQAQGVGNPQYKDIDAKGSKIFDCIDLFMEIEGDDGVVRKYLVTFDDEMTTIVRCQELKPIKGSKEEKNPEIIPFPISLNYLSPTRNDPFGVSYGDLCEDKQRAKSVLKNLKLAAIKAALYPMYQYNRDKIRNRRDLDFAYNKFIAIHGDVGDSTIAPINKAPTHFMETINEEQALDRDVQIATGMDQTTQGVTSDTQTTLGEINRVANNANQRFLLGSKINTWGEKRFWKLWYRMYRQNFVGDKLIRIQSNIQVKMSKITRKAFITKEDPDVIIGSKLESEYKVAQERTAWTVIAPMLLSDPSKPAASKKFIQRKTLRLYKIPQDEIDIMCPESPDESRARMENELLAKNDFVKTKLGEDHLSHNVIHSQCEPTDALVAHINSHKTMYYKSGQAALDRQRISESIDQNNSMANAGMNAMTNQNISMNSKVKSGVAPMGS